MSSEEVVIADTFAPEEVVATPESIAAEAAGLLELHALVDYALLPAAFNPATDKAEPIGDIPAAVVAAAAAATPKAKGAAAAPAPGAGVDPLATSPVPVQFPTRRHKATEEDLTRFLRARKGDPTAASLAFLHMLHFRELFNVDTFLDRPFMDYPLYRTYLPHSYHKHDRAGRPIYIERTGMIDLPKLLTIMDGDDIVRRHIWHMEFISQMCRHATAAQGRPISKGTVIMDLKGLAMNPGNVAMETVNTSLHIDQTYYAERLHQVFIINTPWIFKGIWAIVSMWMDPVTKAKFKILGSNYKDTLLEYVSPECLPVEYGGTCVCGTTAEPGHVSGGGSCVSPACPQTAEEMMAIAGYKNVEITAGNVDTLVFDVPSGGDGTEVHWNWRSGDHDVTFRAVFVPTTPAPAAAAAGAGEGGEVEVHAEVKLNVHKGIFLPPAPGRITMHFSNAHSRFRSKHVYARARVINDPHRLAMLRLLPCSNRGLYMNDVKPKGV